MVFLRQNENWNAEPNAPNPQVEIVGLTLKLSFFLNPFLYEQFNDGDVGVLKFYNCFQYRMGAPNDEGFYNDNQNRYSQYCKYGVEWGHFYRIENSDWETNFPDARIVDNRVAIDTLKHYLFYFRDETIEVIAERYSFDTIMTL